MRKFKIKWYEEVEVEEVFASPPLIRDMVWEPGTPYFALRDGQKPNAECGYIATYPMGVRIPWGEDDA